MARYCENCGTEINDYQEVCLKCGVKIEKNVNFDKASAVKYCYNCGNEVNDNQDICLKCGIKLNNKVFHNTNEKSRITAGVLGIFFGIFGVHNFYLGYTGKGIAQLLITILSFFILSPITYIWSLIESILILVGNIDKDAKGNILND